MPQIQRFALVPHTPDQLFDLVRDVEAYPEFLSWVEQAVVHEETPSSQTASLGLNLAGLKPQFTTQNRLEIGQSVEMSMVEGPFDSLKGQWHFEPLGSGTKVSLSLTFEVGYAFLSTALSRSFSKVADRMVDDFCQRAFEVYDDES